ncbi:MAG: glutamate-1-semialdehyde 2,1-aminomutase [bacterium]|nr:glutamate-1-semialdehyde-2,1-aminomutase [Deltaproteobacteria bacterium]MCP4904047.1 glutamate-1-semialdehyde 2,1-aminomutase [bacterium]
MSQSRGEFKRAKRSIPGGVNSPVRAFGSVSGIPRFIDSAKGARIRDVDGNEYIDYVLSWGPMILGHAHPKVQKALREAMAAGTSFGAPTARESDLAEAIRRVLPSIQKVRMVSSGTEATMSALRLARGVTGRSRILKFDGCYHGHSDGLLVGAGSGVATLGIPGSPGVPKAMTDLTIVAPFNDLAATRKAFGRWGRELAAIIVEPIAGNMGCIPPVPGFLEGLRAICDEFGALLIFDEVMTGFRVARGGAQRLLKVKPDLTTLGKVVGGGLPAAAYGGRRDLMERVAPEGDIYQAGTLSGNPLAVAAGITTLELLEVPEVYQTLAERTAALTAGLAERAEARGIPLTTSRVGGMFGLFFHPGPVESFAQAQQSDAAAFRRFFASMLEDGIYLAPSPYEAGFVSLAHEKRDITLTLEAADRAFAKLARAR